MKTILLYVALCSVALPSLAQKVLNSGTLNYTVNIESSRAGGTKLNNSSLTVYLTANKSRTDLTSTLGSETTVYDGAAGKGFILKEYSGQKLMITATKQNWVEKNQANNDLSFTTEDAVTTVAGYSCKKATAVGADGKKIVVYFTTDVTITNTNYNGAFSQLPGLPVKYEISNGNLKLTYTIESVDFQTVPAAKFDAPSSGYRVMTYDENQQMKVKD